MHPVKIDSKDFPGSVAVVYAEDQPEYIPLPVVRYPNGLVISKWTFDSEEREFLEAGADVYLAQLTYGEPLQPVILGITPESITG